MSSFDYVAPKIFISYSWTSDEYADWVRALAEKLRSNGVDLLKEADLILWLRLKLECDPEAMFSILSWFPVTIGSFQDHHWRVDNFPMFQRAASRRFFDKFKVVLGVDSKDEFLERWSRGFPKAPERGGNGLVGYWERVFNVDTLAST